MQTARLDELIGAAYEGPLEAVPWKALLEAMRRQLNANHVTLLMQRTTAAHRGLVINAGAASTEVVAAYHSLYHALDPFVGLPQGRVVTLAEFLSKAGKSSWTRSAYYERFLRAFDVYHILGADVHLPDGGCCRLRVARPRTAPAFSKTDRVLCGRLLPHLQRSLRIYERLQSLESERRIYAETVDRLDIAAVMLDEEGLIFQTNAVAERLLQEADGLSRNGGQLRASTSGEQVALRGMIAATLSNDAGAKPRIVEAMSIERPIRGGHLGLMIQPVPRGDVVEGARRAAAVLFIRDHEQIPRPPEEILRQIFKFTRAETALAMQLLRGISLEVAADALGVTRNTARSQLSAVFAKVGVNRQTELIRVLLNSVATLRAPSDSGSP